MPSALTFSLHPLQFLQVSIFPCRRRKRFPSTILCSSSVLRLFCLDPVMASLNTAMCIASGGRTTAGPDVSKAVLSQNGLQSHLGLRPLNRVDMLKWRANTGAPSKLLRMEDKRAAKSAKFSKGVIRCGMNLVFVSAEVAPWSKTGGLGDVLSGLPPAMAANGHRVMTISPRYDQYQDAWDTSVVAEVKVGDRMETVRFFHSYKRGVDRIFVDHPLFLAKVWGKTGSKIYGLRAGEDYEDNQLRFSLLSQAALEAPRLLNLSNKFFSGPYGEDVLFIVNDWHTAVLPCYLKSMYKPRGIYKNAKVVYCIHNISYQGRFAPSDFSSLNLPDEFRKSFDFFDGYEAPVVGGKINWMRAGILESDKVVTVSPFYAEELISGAERGVELDKIIKSTGVTGILNGMDKQEWNPSTDKHISYKYDASSVMEAKPLVKEALQAELGLPVDRNIPLIGFIGRLEEQKGSDILVESIPQFIKENVQIVILGTGKKRFERQIEELEVLYPDKARGVAEFNPSLAHKINAGVDFMLIPSRFEPCGLTQLHAMLYGTIPICASTGGLVDCVKEGITGLHMGRFSAECKAVDPTDVAAVTRTVRRAIATHGTPAMREMILHCMYQDLSWKEPARKWEEMLLGLQVAGSGPRTVGEEIAPLALENVAVP